jgi:hypothetical protein
VQTRAASDGTWRTASTSSRSRRVDVSCGRHRRGVARQLLGHRQGYAGAGHVRKTGMPTDRVEVRNFFSPPSTLTYEIPASARSARSMSAAVVTQVPGHIGSRFGFNDRNSRSGSAAVEGSRLTFAFRLLLSRAAKATVGWLSSSLKCSRVRLAGAPARNPSSYWQPKARRGRLLLLYVRDFLLFSLWASSFFRHSSA